MKHPHQFFCQVDTISALILEDGSEILRSPVEAGRLSHYLQCFLYIPGGCLGFLNHQQYLFELAGGVSSSTMELSNP